ncbi:U1 snRNP protein [Coemansia spiralis]|uniref:U1 snRNP protein n=2 Tax=Coemansia TaxID=4863 RepID=A0A9W8KX29_9FUNG|nr:hypothetical protein BX070DRAFT_151216 [Coemansia spiralis]KAJ1990287.1 U1 snRNP protein [Coemansia umbellata]KAJ2619259.1 U1 snRNP protein [Coemansia sp. RSA 1358]KAJ2674172.1 U1 snRNP protein [Coemansia spiralis]
MPPNNNDSSAAIPVGGVSDGVSSHSSSNQLAKSNWAEYTTPEGRVYFFNRETKVTTWEKPDELKTQQERESVWKEYVKDGKPYWYNTMTKKSTWSRPAELGEPSAPLVTSPAVTVVSSASPAKLTAAETSSGLKTSAVSDSPQQLPSNILSPLSTHASYVAPPIPQLAPWRSLNAELGHAGRGSGPQFRPPPPVPPPGALEAPARVQTQKPEYKTPEEAEHAFISMLKAHKVGSDWTWEQTLRAVVNDPTYRALKSLAERKDAFHKYIGMAREAEREEKRILAKQRREGFFALLDSLPICEVTRFRKVRHLATSSQNEKDKEAFLAVPTGAERLRLFNTYVDEMVHELKSLRKQQRIEQMEKVDKALGNVQINAQWAEIKPKLLERFGDLLMPILCADKDKRTPIDQPFFYNLEKKKHSEGGIFEDPEAGLSLLDFMDAFDAAIKRAEKQEAEQKQTEKDRIFRQERQNRDAFRELLKEHSAKTTPTSTWTELYPLIKADQRYIEMLGQAGSTPQELFWDEVELLNEDIYHQRKDVESIMRAEGFRVHIDTPLSDVEEFIKEFRHEMPKVSSKSIKYIYDQLISKVKRRKEEEEEWAARQRRRLLDDFKYALYDLDPELDAEKSTWENEKPRIRRLPEYKDVGDEDACKEMFEQAMVRQREKLSQKRKRQEEPLKRSRSPESIGYYNEKIARIKLADSEEAEFPSDLEEGEMVLEHSSL